MREIDGPAFALGWEQRPEIDACAHEWEPLSVRPYPGSAPVIVERCRSCGAPRCESRSASRSPCVDRRHHRSLHIYADGSFAPLGGILPD